MNILLQLDKSIFLFFNGCHTSWGDIFFIWFTKPYVWILIGLCIALYLLKRTGTKAIIPVLIIIAGLVFTDQSCNLLKNKIKRLRPSHDPIMTTEVQLVTNQDGTFYKGGKYGFPSGHAATSMFVALYLMLTVFNRRWWIVALLLGWVVLFSYSRLYLGVHYPMDIMCGYLLGAFWAILAFLLSKFLKRKTDKNVSQN